MCAGDRFVSFMEEMVRYQDKVLILVPEKEKRILNKEFLNAGYSVREYGKKGLQPSSICEIAYNKEGTERIVQPVESVCVN